MVNQAIHAEAQSQPRRPLMAWLNWCLAVLFVISVFTFQTAYAITNIGVQVDLSLSVAQVGLIGLIYTWAFALTQILSGSILDRMGIRWVLPCAAAIASVGGLIFARANSFETLIAGQVLMAMGGSFGFIGAGYTGGAWFGAAKYGLMFGWVQFVSCLAAIAGQRTLGTLVQFVPWRELMMSMGWAGILLSATMFLFMRNPHAPSQSESPGSGVSSILRSVYEALCDVLSVRDSWINALIGGASFGTMLALGVVWGPKFLIAAGMAQTDAFAASSTMWAGLAIGAPCFIWFSSFINSRKWPMLIGCAAQLITIEVLLLVPGQPPTMASLCFFVWGFMAAGSMLNFAMGAELVRQNLTGTSAAIVNAAQFIAGGIFMAIPGWFLSSQAIKKQFNSTTTQLQNNLLDYQLALFVLPIALLMAIVLFPLLQDTHPRDAA